MGTTDNYDLPYPELSNAANVPLDTRALADATDAALLLVAGGDTETPWTPTWTTTGSAPTLGDGTITGGYTEQGDQVRCWFELIWGSTTAAGTGGSRFTLPVAPTSNRWVLRGVAHDTSANEYWDVRGPVVSNLVNTLVDASTAGNQMRVYGATTIFTWATGDRLFMSGTYTKA